MNMIWSNICGISGRTRIPNEIIPVKAEQSKSLFGHDANWAINLELELDSRTTAGSDGRSWLKITLSKVHCIQQVITYYQDGTPKRTATCTSSDCSTSCSGSGCPTFLLTATTENIEIGDLPLIADCKYGNTVKFENRNGDDFAISDMAITGKQGGITRIF